MTRVDRPPSGRPSAMRNGCASAAENGSKEVAISMAETDLPIRRGLVIPAAEIDELASRASGPGGQHVNKANTRVSLRWSVTTSHVLGEAERSRLLRRLASRLTRRGELLVHADRSRSRSENRRQARERLASLVGEALRISRPRRLSRPTRASRERRLQAKRRRSLVKSGRDRVSPRED